jgi:hypothetical protein
MQQNGQQNYCCEHQPEYENEVAIVIPESRLCVEYWVSVSFYSSSAYPTEFGVFWIGGTALAAIHDGYCHCIESIYRLRGNSAPMAFTRDDAAATHPQTSSSLTETPW